MILLQIPFFWFNYSVEILFDFAYSIAFSLVENPKITSLSVSVEVSQPINGLIELSLVINSKTHFFKFTPARLHKLF